MSDRTWAVIQVARRHQDRLLTAGWARIDAHGSMAAVVGAALFHADDVFYGGARTQDQLRTLRIPFLAAWGALTNTGPCAAAFDGTRSKSVSTDWDGNPTVSVDYTGSIDPTELKHVRHYIRVRNAVIKKLGGRYARA